MGTGIGRLSINPNAMKNYLSLKYAALLSILLIGLAAVSFTSYVQLSGAVSPNMHSRSLTAATSSVGAHVASEISSAKDICASRIITVYEDVYLSFDTDLTPATNVGHIQTGTTTVAYDAEQYGCGAINAIAPATTTISITEFIF